MEERRKINELLTRYELEPSLKDIYVEGIEDKIIIDEVLRKNDITDVSVFDISSIDIDNDEKIKNGNKGRVIELASILSEKLENMNITCIIDNDFDILTGNQYTSPILLTTDFSCMEMYFFDKQIIEQISRSCAKNKLTETIVNKFITPALIDLFKIRFINYDLCWNLKCLNFEKNIRYKNGEFNFDRDEYIKRYLNKNRKVRELSFYCKKINTIKIDSKHDKRSYIHGHDFITLLRSVLNKLRGRKLWSEDELVWDLLKVAADYKDFSRYLLFSTLIKKYSRSTVN